MRKNDTPPSRLPEPTIRLATPRDLEVLCDLLAELFSIEVDFTVDRARQRRGLEFLLQETSRARVFVAEVEDTVVAMCSLQLVISTATGGVSAWLEDVIVAQPYRHRGIGTTLLQHVMSWCDSQQVQRVQLLADEANQPAQQFYRNDNWQVTQLRAWRKMLSEK